MRTIRHLTGSVPATGNDTSLDYYERTVSRKEVAVLANGMMSRGASCLPTAGHSGLRARSTAGGWARFGVVR